MVEHVHTSLKMALIIMSVQTALNAIQETTVMSVIPHLATSQTQLMKAIVVSTVTIIFRMGHIW